MPEIEAALGTAGPMPDTLPLGGIIATAELIGCLRGLPNPVKGRKLAEPEGRVRWLSQEEAEALVEAAQGAIRSPFLADLITVALHTGCRRGEHLGLE